jgi:hypothetical protein
MTTKTDLSPEAWQQLKLAPFAASMYVMTASPSLMGAFGEMGALAKGMQAAAAEAQSGTLMGDLMAELDPKSQKHLLGGLKPKFGTPPDQTMADLLAPVTAAGATIASLSDEDGATYRGFVLSLARSVAEAAKDEGVAVGPKEVAALADLEKALGGS